MNNEVLKKRRDTFLTQMGNGIAVVFAAPEVYRNRDAQYSYRTDSSFCYLTGLMEPGAIALFAPKTDQPYRLFVRDSDPLREMWDGKRYGVAGALKEFAPDSCQAVEEFDKVFSELVRTAGQVYFPLGVYPAVDIRIMNLVGQFRPDPRNGDVILSALKSTVPLLGEQRKLKDSHEIELMRKSAKISAHAHVEAMACIKPGMTEYQLAAKINGCFFTAGAQSLAYESIVATGNNANTLHYVKNRDEMKSGELVLVDAGGELDLYASDITRTYPVNGTFTSAQKDLYEVVLEAQIAGISQAKPGVEYHSVHDVTVRKIVEGLVKLKILSGDVDKIIEGKEYRKFFPHGTGHWLGLDVHDEGSYFLDDGKSVFARRGPSIYGGTRNLYSFGYGRGPQRI